MIISIDLAGTLYNKEPTQPWGQFFRPNSDGKPHISGLALEQLFTLADQGHQILFNTTGLDGFGTKNLREDLANYFLNTYGGMSARNAQKVEELLGNMYLATNRGNRVSKLGLDKSGKITQKTVAERRISAEDMQKIIKALGKAYPEVEIIKPLLKDGAEKPQGTNDLASGHVGLLILKDPTPENFDKVKEVVSKLGFAQIIAPEDDAYFVGKDTGKEMAAISLAKHLGVTKKNVLHIGDGKEDVMKEINNVLIDKPSVAEAKKPKVKNVETALQKVIEHSKPAKTNDKAPTSTKS